MLSSKNSVWLLSVVSYHHELVFELREDSSDSFSEFLIFPSRRSPIFLIQSVGNFKSDISHVEEVLLNFSTEKSLVSKHQTIVVLLLHIVEII